MDRGKPARPGAGDGRGPSDLAIVRIRQALLKWGRTHYRRYPWRETAEPWQALVAEVLLQRTRAQTVVSVYSTFMERYPSWQLLCDVTETDVEALVRPLGLRWRVPLLTGLCHAIAERGGRIPHNLDQLLKLPGVGPYAASATLSLHCGKRLPIVDANVVRWICRLVGAEMDGETRRKRWLLELADELTPQRNWRAFNYAALDFTMGICARVPRCHECPVGPALCAYGAASAGLGTGSATTRPHG